jgi:outer membrane protein assembly factor BamE
MTRSQVRFLLGAPMVIDSFDADRWDYMYSLRRASARLRAPPRRLVRRNRLRVEEPIPLPRPVSATTG